MSSPHTACELPPRARIVGALLGLMCLGLAAGCSDKTAAAAPAAPLDAGGASPVSRDAGQDAGAAAPSRPPAPITPADAGLADAGAQTTSPVPRPAIMPAAAIAKQANEQQLLREYAEALQWHLGEEPLDSFRKEAARMDVGEARFVLVELANAAELRGGRRQWLLVRRPKKGTGPIFYSPLITQAPFTPDYWQQVESVGVTLQSLEGDSRQVLWVRLREKFSESENGGQHIREKERQLAYAFLVDGRKAFTALALNIPEQVTLRVDDELTAQTSLDIRIPSGARLIVRPGPTGVDAEQKGWLGEHPLTR